MIVLAHRGLWRTAAEKNSLGALREALTQGFGIETDLRDHDGRGVISHDPPTGTAPALEQFLDMYVETGSAHTLALNVKSDGLQEKVQKALADRHIGPEKYFLFDMAVPDALGYFQLEMPCFTRESELEPAPAYVNQAAGVWLDCFFQDWINKGTILKHIDAGRRVALVSPELHGRDKSIAWKNWREAANGLRSQGRADQLMICTDHPAEARTYFDGED